MRILNKIAIARPTGARFLTLIAREECGGEGKRSAGIQAIEDRSD